MTAFVPLGLDVPLGLETADLALEPLGPEHGERDYGAWTRRSTTSGRRPGIPTDAGRG